MACVAGQKRYRALPTGEARFIGISERHLTLAGVDPFGHAGFILLRGRGRCQPSQRLAVIPRHPGGRTPVQLVCVPLEFSQIVKRVDAI